MSHIVTIESKLHDVHAIHAACQRLGLELPTEGTTRLFSGNATGVLVKLPGWLYPVVVDTLTGLVRFANYGERWGKQAELDRFLQAYAVEKARLEAKKKGYQVSEQALQDGSIKLQIIEGS
jgi:hypothetical protein